MTHKIRQHTYTTEELKEAVEYIENDIVYLEKQLAKYKENKTSSYVCEKVAENIEYDKAFLKEFLEALA